MKNWRKNTDPLSVSDKLYCPGNVKNSSPWALINIKRKPKGQSRMDNPEKTEGAIKNGQSRENRRGNQEWTAKTQE
jgi:hypothetical protein